MLRNSLTFFSLVLYFQFFAQTPSIKFEEYTLENGLQVILHENHTTPIVAVSVMYHVGSKNEKPNRTGFAHFFEHLLFEGSKNIKRGEFFKYIENAGGQNNANTSNDRTFYYEVLPSNQLELGLWLESERLLHANINQDGIDTQNEVVKEEKRLRVDNQPYGSFFAEINKRAFKEHPYKWTTIGEMEHLDAATLDEFIDFYHKFYVPENAILSIAGDIDVAATKKLINSYFGTIPNGGNKIEKVTIVEPPLGGEIRDTIYDDVQLPGVMMAYRAPEQGSKDFYAIEMMSKVLSDGESSRLNKTCVEKSQSAMYCGSFPFPSEDPGLSFVYSIANSGVNPLDLEKEINNELNLLQTTLVSEKEMQKIRNMIENDFVGNFTSMIGIAENLANYKMYFGDADLINTELDRYLKVTKEDIMRVANDYFKPSNRVVLYYLPKENG
ncbi:MAG: pitrilysin family protein [Flavobacteriales bacterium]|nr:pitrilysin family protein [Flavobacteriales bacterium]